MVAKVEVELYNLIMANFMKKAMAGKIDPKNYDEEIEAAIENWASIGTSEHLHEHIGMTWEEWGDWFAFSKPMEMIIAERKSKNPKRKIRKSDKSERVAAHMG